MPWKTIWVYTKPVCEGVTKLPILGTSNSIKFRKIRPQVRGIFGRLVGGLPAMGPRCLSSKDARAPYTLVVRAPGKKTQRLPWWKMPGVDITINRNSYGFGILNRFFQNVTESLWLLGCHPMVTLRPWPMWPCFSFRPARFGMEAQHIFVLESHGFKIDTRFDYQILIVMWSRASVRGKKDMWKVKQSFAERIWGSGWWSGQYPPSL